MKEVVLRHLEAIRPGSAHISNARRVTIALFGLLAIWALGSSARAQNVVGEFEIAAPTVSSFVLHGTLPVPKGTFPRTDGKLPLSIRNSNGAIVAAQLEPVTWYPNLADGADVVEIIARVNVPAGKLPGQSIQYQVIDNLHDPATFTKTPAVQGLLAGTGQVVIRTRDVFGHLYTADLLRGVDGVKQLRSGAFRQQQRNYQVMRPATANIGPPSGALERMMGVHAYVSTWAGEDVVSLDLRVHNGTSGLDHSTPIDDPQTHLYFTALEIVVPQGWALLHDLPDVGIGAPYNEGVNVVYPIVKAQTNGKLHVMPEQAQFERRLVLARSNAIPTGTSMVKSEWQAFCQPGASGPKPYYSWWNRKTARYFPQRHALPRFDYMGKSQTINKLRAQYYDDLDWLKSGVKKGAYPFMSDQMGWSYPFGVQYGGMTGGSDIYLYDGELTAWAASWEGYRHAQLFHRTYLERHPVALYNKNGDPTSLGQWIIHGSQFDYVDMQFYLTLIGGHDPFGFDVAPQYQVLAAQAQGKTPSYQNGLLAYKPIDVQHHIRVLRNHKVMTWLGNDAMVKDDLMMAAELLRLSYHSLPNYPNGNFVGNGMLADIKYVDVNPGAGFAVGRGEAWTIDGMAAAYSIAPAAWRAAAKPWFDEVTFLMRDGQASCSGFLMRLVTSKDFNGNYAVRRSTETSMIEHALVGVLASVYEGVDASKQQVLENVLTKSLYAMITTPSWHPGQDGPISSIAVAPLSGAPYCGTSPAVAPDVDKFQSWSSLAYGWEITNDNIFLQRAAEMSGASSMPNLLHAQENMNFGNHENRAALLALAQILFH